MYTGNFTLGVVEGCVALTEEVLARTGYNAEETAIILPGRFVVIAPDLEGRLETRGLILPVADSNIVGVVRRWDFLNPIERTISGEVGHKPKDQMAYLIRGVIGMKPIVAVKAGDPVYAVVTVGATQGQFTNAAGVGALLVPNARVVDSSDADVVTRVSVNFA